MARSKQPYSVPSKPSQAPSKHKAPWSCKWWELTTDKNGTQQTRKTKWFTTKAKAISWGKQKEHDRLYSDSRQFSDSERAMVLHFIKECESRGLNLNDVFTAGMQHLNTERISNITLEEGKELFSIWMMSEDYSPKTIKNLENSVQWVIKRTQKDRLVSSFTSSELVILVKGRYTQNHTSQKSFLRDLRSFFSWAAINTETKRPHCSASIASNAQLDGHHRKSSAKKTAARRNNKRPPRFTVEQIKTIFTTTDERFHPAFALGIIAGLRPETELMLIEWEMIDNGHKYGIDFERKVVHLHQSWVTKTLRERTITDLPDVFWRIMKKHQGTGKVVPCNYRNWRISALDPVKAKLKLSRWPTDIMRHTALSFQYILIGQSITMNNAGHSNPKTFQEHYNNAVSGAEAKAFTELET